MITALKVFLRRTPIFRILNPYLFHLRGKLFDLHHGVRTCGEIPLRTGDVESPNIAFGLGYQGIDPRIFDGMIRGLQIRFEDYVFIDLGSGKGRALLLASEYPFKEIVGIEFSNEWHQTAQENIRKYRSASQKCRAISSVCLDAAAYPIPEQPTVFFFYNSFREPVLISVLSNIEKSVAVRPRHVLFVYVNPELAHVLDARPAWTRVDSGPWHRTYQAVSALER